MAQTALLFVLILGLIILSPRASFCEDGQVSGEVSGTARVTEMTGNKAKLYEYSDDRDGVYGGFRLHGEKDGNYVDALAADIAFKTQQYLLQGGQWGSYRYDLRYQEIPHNYTFGARSIYSGAGSTFLTYPTQPPGTDVSNWSQFDYGIERDRFRGGITVEKLKPYFFNVAVFRETKKGIYPAGAAGTTPGGISIELPRPVDYTTDSLQAEAGYIRKPYSLSVNYMLGTLDNKAETLLFRNPATDDTAAATDVLTSEPENRYWRLGLKGAVTLPLQSKFSANLALSSMTSESNLLSSYVSSVSAAASNIGVQGLTGILLSSPTFNGRLDVQNYDFMLTSTPLSRLDTKFFYKHYETSNKSNQITTTDTTQSPSTFVNSLFDYHKDRYGLGLGFRLPAKFYLSTAYTYTHTVRKREDIPENDDNLYAVDLRWSGLDFMVVRIGYERLIRTADFQTPNVPPDDPQVIETWIRRFDAASQNRDTVSAAIDFFPMEDLHFSIGFRWRDATYPDTILGLRESRAEGFNFDFLYQIAKPLKLYGSFDYEQTKQYQFQRQLPFNATSGFDPSLPPTSTAFNWDATQIDRSYACQIGADLSLVPGKWTLQLGYSYIHSDGSVDYSYLLGSNPLPPGRTQDNIDIYNWDKYSLQSYLVRLNYDATKNWTFHVGYVHEKYDYDDAQYDGYQFVPATTGTNGAYLTGAYMDPSYSADIVFLGASYKF
jgi:MtrB/PioB family decaheme-associated outer membrane protein